MLTPHCSAASGIVVPPSIVSTTRLRKSAEYGFANHAGRLPAGSVNHIRAARGSPDSAFPGNALSTGVARCSSNGEDVHARLMVGKAHKHHTQQIRCPEGAELGAYWRDAPRAASSQRFMAANVS